METLPFALGLFPFPWLKGRSLDIFGQQYCCSEIIMSGEVGSINVNGVQSVEIKVLSSRRQTWVAKIMFYRVCLTSHCDTLVLDEPWKWKHQVHAEYLKASGFFARALSNPSSASKSCSKHISYRINNGLRLLSAQYNYSWVLSDPEGKHQTQE